MKRTLLCLLVFVVPALAQQYDVLIKNGKLVDGSGNPWIYADVGIIGDRVAFVGHADPKATAKKTIDATGLVVAPGFIDMLGQSEMNILIDKRAVSKLTQGITTEITGEGESIAPQNNATIAEQKDFLDHYHVTIDWTTLDGYFRRLERQGSGINIGTYVGAAQLRRIAIGTEDRAATPAEIHQMQEMVDDAMDDGALGISSALIYAPGSYASTEELIALAKIAGEDGGIYASHIRNEGDAEPQALEEAFRIGREAELPVEIFHFKCAAQQNWGKMPQMIALVEKARAEGVDVNADQYPYIASATSLGAVIPPKYHSGGTDAFTARLKDPAVRAAIRKELEAPPQGEIENMWRGTGGPQGILVVSVLNPDLKKYEGKNLAQIAEDQHKDPFDTMLDFVIADHDNTGAVYFEMSEPDVKLAMQQPWVSVDNDYGAIAPDGPLSDSKSHPRAYGSFPRILGKYVRDEHVLTLENAIRKFTSLPAQREHLRDRGLVRTNYFADITVFDPQTIHDVATFEDPDRTSVGIEYVLVNGVVEMDQGKLNGDLGGRPLRGNAYYARNYNPEGLPMKGEVRGVAIDPGGYPVGRVAVTLLGKNGEELGKMTTHYDGKYAIPYEKSCVGCRIKAERMGYTTVEQRVDYNGANSLWFSLVMKRNASPGRATKKRS